MTHYYGHMLCTSNSTSQLCFCFFVCTFCGRAMPHQGDVNPGSSTRQVKGLQGLCLTPSLPIADWWPSGWFSPSDWTSYDILFRWCRFTRHSRWLISLPARCRYHVTAVANPSSFFCHLLCTIVLLAMWSHGTDRTNHSPSVPRD